MVDLAKFIIPKFRPFASVTGLKQYIEKYTVVIKGIIVEDR